MSNEQTETPEPIDMDVVESQLKKLPTEQFEQIAQRVGKVADQRTDYRKKLSVMTNNEFEAEKRKLGI